MIQKKFDASIPRKMFWSNEIPNSKACPRCNAKLEREYQTYLIATLDETLDDNESESFISGNDDGYFCPNCAIIVLDSDRFTKLVAMISRSSTRLGFAVLGIVNFDAIPEDKKDMPIGEKDNPIPLVQFTNLLKKNNSVKKRKKKVTKHP